MTHNGTVFVGLLGLLGALVWGPASASACETLCARFLPDRGEMIPSNTPALALLYSGELAGPVRLTRIDGDRDEAVDIRVEPQQVTVDSAPAFALIRVAGLVEGARYSLVHDVKDSLGCRAASRSFAVGPPAAFPSVLGQLSATPSRSEVIKAPCVNSFWGARSDLELDLDEQILPWRYLLLYRSVVDGAARGYRSDIGLYPPEGRLQMPCNEDGSGPDSQTYDAYLEAWIPGLTDTFQSAAVSVELRCEQKPTEAPEVDAGTDMSSVTIVPMAPAAEGCSVPRGPAPHARHTALALIACMLGLYTLRRGRRSARRR